MKKNSFLKLLCSIVNVFGILYPIHCATCKLFHGIFWWGNFRKRLISADFRAIRTKIFRNWAFAEKFRTRKLGEKSCILPWSYNTKLLLDNTCIKVLKENEVQLLNKALLQYLDQKGYFPLWSYHTHPCRLRELVANNYLQLSFFALNYGNI